MISRGSVYYASLDPDKGREQAGRRPVLVVSVDAINHQPLVVTVAVGTVSKNVPRDYPTNVRVTARESGLPKDTVFLCFQIRSIDPGRLLDPRTSQPALIGSLPATRMAEVEKAMRLVLGL